MKRLLTAVIIGALSFSALADVKVRGYYRKDGTYVAPHYRSDPDGIRDNNWSTQGNINPYTGEAGTKPKVGDGGGYYYGGNVIIDSPAPKPYQPNEIITPQERCALTGNGCK